jgi:hypothetical protein
LTNASHVEPERCRRTVAYASRVHRTSQSGAIVRIRFATFRDRSDRIGDRPHARLPETHRDSSEVGLLETAQIFREGREVAGMTFDLSLFGHALVAASLRCASSASVLLNEHER